MRGENRTRMIALALLIGLLAAIPASTQVVSADKVAVDDGTNLRMVVLVNRLDLTKEQMQTIHDALAGVLVEIDALDSRRAEFYDEMLRFNGTADELDQALSAFRDEMSAAGEGLRSDMREAIDEIAGTLTMKQGEILRRAIPGMYEREMGGRRYGMGGTMMLDRFSEGRAPLFGGVDPRMRGMNRQRPQSRFQPERSQGSPVPLYDRGGERERIGKWIESLRDFVETLALKLNYLSYPE